MTKRVAIVGAGIFGLSLALALRRKGHDVLVFDQHAFDKSGYHPSDSEPDKEPELVASVDHNKIVSISKETIEMEVGFGKAIKSKTNTSGTPKFRASYGKKIDYQRLALESREEWKSLDKDRNTDLQLFVPAGMLRVQPTSTLSALEKETLASLERDGLRDTQFVKSDRRDRRRAAGLGWQDKLLDFTIPKDPQDDSFEAVLDSLAGFTRCSDGCAYYQKMAEKEGVTFVFGSKEGRFEALVKETTPSGKKKAVGLKTADGKIHKADVVAVAAGSFSTQVLPDLSYHLESSAGSIATFKIDPMDKHLWDKYSPEKFPVMTWKSAPRNKDGKDTGSVYVLPRTPEGLLKIGYRGIKFTNFQPAPEGTPFTQDGLWSIPMPPSECKSIPEDATYAIRYFVSIFLPEFTDTPFYSSKLCWYTDTLDNSFLIDYVPTYADNSVFVCTGGSGHGAKFMPVLGKHAADIFENHSKSQSPMRPLWRWREDAPRRNGLEEGPSGPRNIGRKVI